MEQNLKHLIEEQEIEGKKVKPIIEIAKLAFETDTDFDIYKKNEVNDEYVAISKDSLYIMYFTLNSYEMSFGGLSKPEYVDGKTQQNIIPIAINVLNVASKLNEYEGQK